MSSRALSTTLGYVLTLGITAILMSGLLISGGTFVEDQRERVVQTELQVIGEQLASQINAADRLNQSGDGATNVSIEQPFPADVAGSTYRVTLDATADPVLRLEATQPDVAVDVALTNTTAMGQSTASGGSVVIEYDPDRATVVIDSA